MNHRFLAIDIVRILAVLLVVYGHFVSVGGGATTIPGVVTESTKLPIFDYTLWSVWSFEVFLIEKFSTQTAILGVTIFFIVTGYLMPVMMERYSSIQFLINRFFRIIPLLIVSMLIIALFVNYTQNIVFTLKSYIASVTLSYLFIGVVPIVGVLWTLIIEVIFYLITAIIGKFTFEKLILLQVIILSIIVFDSKYPNLYYLHLIVTNIKYILIIAIGSSIFLASKESSILKKFIYISSSIVISYIGLYIFKLNYQDTSTYSNIGTLLLGTFIVLFAIWGGKYITSLPKQLNIFSELVYPIYLIHVPFGLGMMIILREYFTSPYLLTIISFIIVVIISYILHIYVEKIGIAYSKKLIKSLEKDKNI